jgi:predicted transcriptional regulator
LFLDSEHQNGANHPSAKLSEENVREIRSIKLRNKSRKTLDECANYFGVSRETIRKIVLKRTSGEGKLSESQVKQVKEMYRPVETYKKFLDLGVSKGAISSITAGRTWKYLK